MRLRGAAATVEAEWADERVDDRFVVAADPVVVDTIREAFGTIGSFTK